MLYSIQYSKDCFTALVTQSFTVLDKLNLLHNLMKRFTYLTQSLTYKYLYQFSQLKSASVTYTKLQVYQMTQVLTQKYNLAKLNIHLIRQA